MGTLTVTLNPAPRYDPSASAVGHLELDVTERFDGAPPAGDAGRVLIGRMVDGQKGLAQLLTAAADGRSRARLVSWQPSRVKG